MSEYLEWTILAAIPAIIFLAAWANGKGWQAFGGMALVGGILLFIVLWTADYKDCYTEWVDGVRAVEVCEDVPPGHR